MKVVWTIKKKLITSFVVVSAITLFVGIVGIYSNLKTNKNLTALVEERIPLLMALGNLNKERMTIRSQTLDVFYQAHRPDNVAGLKRIQEQRAKSWERVDSNFDKLMGITLSSDESVSMRTQLATEYEKWRQIYKELDKSIENLVTAKSEKIRADEYAHYESVVQRMIPISDAMGKKCVELTDYNTNLTDQQMKSAGDSEKASDTLIVISFVAMIAGVLFAVGIGLFMSGNINSQLGAVVHTLHSGAEHLASVSHQLASSRQMLVQGVAEQAATLEEISSSVEELTAMTQQNAENSREANSLGKTADQAGSECVVVVKNMALTMEEIKAASDKTAMIIKTIDEIAMQTNLLALNAAIEAARAGEAGRGFAVVAEEVRSLALRSAEAAKSTSELIEGMQASSQNGVGVAGEVEKSIGVITHTVAHMATLLEDVSAASGQQASGLDQICNAINQLEQVAQSTANNTEETALAGDELHAQAEVLTSIVGELTALVKGRAHESAVKHTGHEQRLALHRHGEYGTLQLARNEA